MASKHSMFGENVQLGSKSGWVSGHLNVIYTLHMDSADSPCSGMESESAGCKLIFLDAVHSGVTLSYFERCH